MPRITLTGYIYRDPDGMYVSHCIELDTDTWAPTLEEARNLTPHMISGYFAAAQKMGMLDQALAGLAAANPLSHGSFVAEQWQAHPRGTGLQFDAQFSAAA